jgi:nitrate/nitrite-specific signal transduction histidine kinase
VIEISSVGFISTKVNITTKNQKVNVFKDERTYLMRLWCQLQELLKEFRVSVTSKEWVADIKKSASATFMTV